MSHVYELVNRVVLTDWCLVLMVFIWFVAFWLLCLIDSLFAVVFFFKQKTAYEMRISDWSSDVCSSDLHSVGDHCTAASSGSSTAGRERIMSSSKKVNFSPSMSTNSGSSGMLYLRCAGSLPMLSASSRLSYHSSVMPS